MLQKGRCCTLPSCLLLFFSSVQEKIKMLKETRLVVASVTRICAVDFRSASVVDWWCFEVMAARNWRRINFAR